MPLVRRPVNDKSLDFRVQQEAQKQALLPGVRIVGCAIVEDAVDHNNRELT
jgi:hypothetical protein